MKHNITRRSALASLAWAVVALPELSLAQADRPVKFILPNATGSGIDAITRAAAPALGKACYVRDAQTMALPIGQ